LKRNLKQDLLLATATFALISGGTVATAQEAPAATGEDESVQETVIVVGSQIQGANVADVLPVTLIDERDLDALAISSGEDLIKSIPSQGATNFSGDSETGGVNGARGDVASLNLRSLGTGNTLALLNGRRLVLHPGSQAENLVPVVTPNLNALPTGGIRRLEVLRDGASAIYGADAVGGVINTVLRDNYEGLELTARYGGYDGLDAKALTLSAYGGMDFNDGKTNVTVFGSYYDRGGILATERDYSANDDLRPFVVGTAFEGDAGFNNTTTNTAWGQFDTTRRVRRGSTSLTSAAGRFHIQPKSSPGCLIDINPDICIDDSTADTALRHNNALFSQPASDLERYNFFSFINHKLDNGHEAYGEVSYYYANSSKIREASTPLSSTPITISRLNYWNPFGVTGNPNRLAGIDAPAAGLDITIGGADGRYRVLDAGPRLLEVENTSYRLLGGLRGDWGDWSYDTAVVYSRADTDDTTDNRISNTLFQRALNGGTPNDYNPFNGGDINNPTGLDATPNPQSVIDSFLISVSRKNFTTLALFDFKVSNNDFYTLPAGKVGAAFGVEWRSETYEDDRDDRLDGTILFTDSVTGETFDSDVMGSSSTPDTKGDRQTASAWAEFYVPLIGTGQNVPFVHRLDAQIAGRFENASDFGSVFAPKLALSYYPVDWFQVRSSYSEGFRAPNLDQVNAEGIQRSNTRTDYYRCQAQLVLNQITSLAACGQNQGVQSVRSGSDELEAETNETFTVGLVFQPDRFIPGLTITADYYSIQQDNVVGIAGDDLQIILDFVARVNGTSNPLVTRAAPDADDIAFFAGSGLAPVGNITSVADPYLNLESRKSEGFDFGIYYELDDTRFGDFSFKIDATYLSKFDQAPSSVVDTIRAEPLADAISLAGSVGSLIGIDGQPEWRGVARFNWDYGNWGAGASVNYVGSYFDTSIVQDQTGEFWTVDEWVTANFYVDYTFRKLELAGLNRVQVRVGATNITNEDPPLVDETYGYDTAYHDNRGRFVYAQIRATF
jgi:iron complex outermembrane recepter protein